MAQSLQTTPRTLQIHRLLIRLKRIPPKIVQPSRIAAKRIPHRPVIMLLMVLIQIILRQ